MNLEVEGGSASLLPGSYHPPILVKNGRESYIGSSTFLAAIEEPLIEEVRVESYSSMVIKATRRT